MKIKITDTGTLKEGNTETMASKIMKSKAYKLVIAREIVAEGSLREMSWLKKKLGGMVVIKKQKVGTKDYDCA